jgi:F0F1-type ATP synthase membrane subunit b/b'
MEILHQLGINQGFFWMLGLYLGTFVIVYFLGLKDLSALVVERNKRIQGRAEKAVHLKEELKAIQESLASQMKKVRIEANEAFFSIRTKAISEQKSILNSAREKAAEEVNSVRKSTALKTETELKKLEIEIPALADLILNQIIMSGNDRKKSISPETRG